MPRRAAVVEASVAIDPLDFGHALIASYCCYESPRAPIGLVMVRLQPILKCVDPNQNLPIFIVNPWLGIGYNEGILVTCGNKMLDNKIL